MIVSVIMAGGRGERFWPASRTSLPKQFLCLNRERTLFQEAVARIQPLIGSDRVFPVTGLDYVDIVRSQAPDIPADHVLVEPMARDTAACLALAAFELRAKFPDEDPTMIVLAADHLIADADGFRRILRAAAQVASEEECVVVLGIPPTAPVTGYGYIQFQKEPACEIAQLPVHNVRRFREKPNLETAQEYLASGEYFWNSGMFVWRTSYFLRSLAQHLPQHYQDLGRLFAGGRRPGQEELRTAFAGLERISVDYGIMERIDRAKVIPADIGWNDVGNWASIAAYLPGWEENAVAGDATLLETEGCVVYAETGHIAAVGLRDLVIVRVGETVLVCPKERAQDVKKIVDRLAREGRKDLL